MRRYITRKEPVKLIDMIKTINEIGVSKLKVYAKENHARFDFETALETTKYVARNGYSGCCTKFNISRQRAEQRVKKLYDFAIEIKEG